MRRFLPVVLIALAASPGARGLQSPPGLFTRLDPVVDALWSGFDTGQAQQHVEFISRHWRLPGNAGYDATIDRVQARLSAAGFAVAKDAAASRAITTARLFVDQYPNTESGGWDHTVGTLAIARSGDVPAQDEIVLSREKERLALCINSFSTPREGLLFPLYDVGRGDQDADYAGKNLKGAVVLGDADVGQLWRRAVVNGGAIGVVSTALPRYISPDPPGAKPTPRDEWDILQWGSIPYDATRKGFGFKASPRAAARLRKALGPRVSFSAGSSSGQMPAPKTKPEVFVRVTIASTFSAKPNRTLVAEIPGRVAPSERVILAAHVQEPGANDNASGVATLAELAVSLQNGIRAGKIPAPGRTLTFLFLTEIGGSRRWLQDHADDAKNVRYMISMDMTGEDVAKTGGSFLVERWPDPGAVWDRPWDPHTEWGRGSVKAEQLKGDLINDAHLAICRRVARKGAWVVNSNPYEGGSDHTVFGSAGVPSVLDWHFTDRYYHTNFDTADKTSPAEMRNVGVCAAATAWLFGSADSSMAMAVAELVANAGKTRIATEESEGTKLAAADKDPAAAKTRETQIVAAWRKWYGEAVRSVARLVVGPAPADFSSKLDALAAPFQSREMDGEGDELPQVRRDPPADVRLLTCGTDMLVTAAIPVRWDTVALAADSRGFTPCPAPVHGADHRESRERTVLGRALGHRDPELRRLAARAVGQIGARVPESILVEISDPPAGFPGTTKALLTEGRPGALAEMLNDTAPAVRREAANAIGDLLSGVPREMRPAERPAPEEIAAGRSVLESRLKIERIPSVSATILSTLGRLKYADDATRDDVEAFLVEHATEPPDRIQGAAEGLEALIRGNPKRQISARTREQLRMWATSSRYTIRTRILALMSLQQARDDDVRTLVQASNDGVPQVRRLVALRLDGARDEFRPIIDLLSTDTDFTVRYEMLNVFARQATRTRDCAGLIRYFDDREPTVVLRAIDLLPPVCGENDNAVDRLTQWAEELKTPLSSRTWHAPAHALQALARLRPEAGRPLLEEAAKHAIWQVRARAAASCEDFKDADTARGLAGDREPNVRDAALGTLVRLQSEVRFSAAAEALKSDDFQLLRTAAITLRGTPEAERAEAVNQLLNTLKRLTDGAADTSRDPRVAILERLGELLPVERTPELAPYRLDFDPKVREAATAALAKVTQTEPPAATSGVKHRYPYQPVEEMSRLPRGAILTMEGGSTIELELFVNDAPVTVARFSELARAGYYDGLTFHRVVPNFVIQGGSPGANEYTGSARYMRDEIGALPHLQGYVGISTRGRDTGDAQIFIDLVDIPRLDHEYTVFARVVRGFDVVQRVLEGAKIVSMTVK